MTTRLAIVGALILGGLFAAPAYAANTAPDIIGLIGMMQKSAPRPTADFRSFQAQFKSPQLAAFILINRDLAKSQMIVDRNGERSTMYIVGTINYFQDHTGAAWTKMDMAPFYARARKVAAKPKASRTSAPWKRQQFLPDQRINGVPMRVSHFSAPLSAINPLLASHKVVTVTCLYEERSGWLRSCSAGKFFSMTLGHYNDPANDFNVPAAALQARSMSSPY